MVQHYLRNDRESASTSDAFSFVSISVFLYNSLHADMAELADALVSGSSGNTMQVQVLLSALKALRCFFMLLLMSLV